MFQEKNEKKSHKIKNIVFFQGLKKITLYKKYIYIVFLTLKVVFFDIF